MVIIFFGLVVGLKLLVEVFFMVEILGILGFGVIVFGIGIVVGVFMVKLMSKLLGGSINLLIGVVGVFVVLMVVRVVNKVGLEVNFYNFLFMYVMGFNVVGVLGSVVVVGILLVLVG